MSDRDSTHLLEELQHARSELDRLRRLVLKETAVDVRGTIYHPAWVVNEFYPKQGGDQ